MYNDTYCFFSDEFKKKKKKEEEEETKTKCAGGVAMGDEMKQKMSKRSNEL